MRHRRMTTALACVGAILVLAGGLISYAGHVVSNSTQFATRATSALGDPSMRSVIASRVTAEVVGKRSDLIAVRPLIETAVDAIVGSAPFQAIFEGAIYDLHRSVFTRASNTFTLRLADVGVLAQAALRTYAPSVAAKVPAAAGTTLTAVAKGDFRSVSDVARSLNRAREAGPWLLLGGVLLLAVSVALSTERGIAARRAGIALVTIGLLVAVVTTVARPLVVSRFAAGDARTAAGVVWDAFLADLRVWALGTAAAGGLLVACVAALSAPREASIVSLLRRGLTGEQPSNAAVAVISCVLIAAGWVALAAPGSVLNAGAMLIGASLLYAGARRLLGLALTVDLHRLRATRPARVPARSAVRLLRLGAAAGVLAALALASALLTHDEPALAHPINACNGYAQLCDRPLNDVVFPATHNSMASATDSGWLFPSQDAGITAQLEAGVRGLLIDTHYGLKATRGVATELTAKTSKLAAAVDAVGPEFIASAKRLRATIGIKPQESRAVYLCHAFCEVGATLAQQALTQIRDFLVRHPNEVVILSIEDDVSPTDTEAVFRQSGLLDLVYQGPSGSWPRLRQLIEQDRRVIVFAENDSGGISWYRPQFELMEETPYRFTSTRQLAEPASCRANRGATGKPLFLLNNWVDTSPAPKPTNAATVNAYDILLARARRCQESRHHIPNLLAIDFYKRGDVMRVAATLNGV